VPITRSHQHIQPAKLLNAHLLHEPVTVGLLHAAHACLHLAHDLFSYFSLNESTSHLSLEELSRVQLRADTACTARATNLRAKVIILFEELPDDIVRWTDIIILIFRMNFFVL
jgi:hypothetical protein